MLLQLIREKQRQHAGKTDVLSSNYISVLGFVETNVW